jgi:myo-inositol-1(or 4)-monophosphatase
VPIRVSAGDVVADARICGPKGLMERLSRVLPPFRIEPLLYSVALRLARVADGTYDAAFASRSCCDWDLAAADLLVHEAGGALTTIAADELAYNGENVIHDVLVAAGRPRHRTLCTLLQGHAARFR